MLPSAVQSLTKTGLVRRSAKCPVHDKQSSNYLGLVISQTGAGIVWEFRCRTTDHIFAAKGDPTAPKTPAEATRWVLEARAKLAGVKLEKQLQ